MKGSAVITATAAQIALSQNRLVEIFTEKLHKAAMPANITAGYRTTGVYPTTPRLFPTQPLLPVC